MRADLPSIRKVISPPSNPITVPRSRLATPRSLLGAVNWMRSPVANSRSSSRKTFTPLQSARVVGDGRTALQCDGEQCLPRASTDRTVAKLPRSIPSDFAAGGVLEHVAGLVARRPRAICAGHIGAVGRACGRSGHLLQVAPLLRSSARTASLICWRLRLSGETMMVFSGLAA